MRACTALTAVASENRLQLRLAAGLQLHLGDGLGMAGDQGLHHLLTLTLHFLQQEGTQPRSATPFLTSHALQRARKRQIEMSVLSCTRSSTA